jgi:signal transduction histidine kinase
MRRVVSLETRLPVDVTTAEDIMVTADPDQLEQLLINLLRNAVDAALETGGGVSTSWFSSDHVLEVRIDDQGPGIQNTGNLFVPFFTTKAGGSGIGLVLSRQIAEGHGGSLTLENRADERGVRATLRIPL